MGRKAVPREIALLKDAAHKVYGDQEVEIVGGDVRLNGQDALAAVAYPEHDDQPGSVFVWVISEWRRRRDLDPDTVRGLIEWPHARQERKGDEWAGEEYDPA